MLRLAVGRGYIDPARAREALAHQRALAAAGQPASLLPLLADELPEPVVSELRAALHAALAEPRGAPPPDTVPDPDSRPPPEDLAVTLQDGPPGPPASRPSPRPDSGRAPGPDSRRAPGPDSRRATRPSSRRAPPPGPSASRRGPRPAPPAAPPSRGDFTTQVLESNELGAPPAAIGDYRVERELGRGGMGVVYVVREPDDDERRALKLLLPGAGQAQVDRFLVEARALTRLRHPCLVGVRDMGRSEGMPYLVMDLLEGDDLAARVARDGPLPPRDAAEIARRLALGLAHVHEHGLLHRDVKPDNVVLGRDGGPVLTDFGLARDEAEPYRLTRTGEAMGTPDYMAPEQATASRDRLGPATDVWGLGATLYELLCGQPPLGTGDPAEVMRRIVSEAPRPPSELQAEVDPELEAIVLRCLEKDPTRRYPDMEAVADELDQYLYAGRVAPAVHAAPRRRPWRLLAAVGLVLALAAAGVALMLLARG